MNKTISKLVIVLWAATLAGCFRPALPISTGPTYPVDVFYANQHPNRPFREVSVLELSDESPIVGTKKPSNRLRIRGNDMEQKELILAKLTLQAKKLGADALINVRYQYYTNASVSGYRMTGLAVTYSDGRSIKEEE